MDSLKLIWQSYSYKDEKVLKVKNAKDSLEKFIQDTKLEGYYPRLVYEINGISLEKWWSENIKNGLFYLKYESEGFSYILNPHSGREIFKPALHLQLHQMLGKKISLQSLKEFGYDLKSRKDKEWDEFIEDENFNTQLYGCSACFDYQCGYLPLFIKKGINQITWTFRGLDFDIKTDYHFIFSYQDYLNEFKELVKLILKK